MSDASGTYASPTGSELQDGGAGQRQGIDEGYENVSFQLDTHQRGKLWALKWPYRSNFTPSCNCGSYQNRG